MIDHRHLSSMWWFGSVAFAAALAAILLPGAAANQEPIAVAGNDSVLLAVEPFVLNGSASYDPDGDNLTCDWGWSGAPAGRFDNRTECTTTFYPAGSGIFHFRLTVRDPDGINWTQNYPDFLPAIGHGVAVDHITVYVDNHPPHIVSTTPPGGQAFGQESSYDQGHGVRKPISAGVGFAARAEDPDAGNLSWEWYVDGAKASPGEHPGDLAGNGSFGWSFSAGTYHVRAVVSDGVLNDSTEWVVHVVPFTDTPREFLSTLVITALVGTATGITIGIARWLWRARGGH